MTTSNKKKNCNICIVEFHSYTFEVNLIHELDTVIYIINIVGINNYSMYSEGIFLQSNSRQSYSEHSSIVGVSLQKMLAI